MEKLKRGIGVSHGYVVGKAFVLDSEDYRIPARTIPKKEVKRSIERFEEACEASTTELQESLDAVSKSLGEELTMLLKVQMSWLADKGFQSRIREDIQENQFSPEYAVSQYFRKKIKKLEESGVEAFIQRINDLRDIERRVLKNLLGQQREDLSSLEDDVILVARDLTPSETMGLDRERILGILTEKGGRTSHTAILAASLKIPAVVGLEGIPTEVSGGDTLILDGSSGTVIINPERETVKRYTAMAFAYVQAERALNEELRDLAAETTDGTRVSLLANIDMTEEIHAAIDYGADGVGLYRTEFLYLGNREEPKEDDHYSNYHKALTLLDSRKLVIRTCDLGADKIYAEGVRDELNPSLGTRAIRLSFDRLDMFSIQLRALLRVSVHGKMKIMLPLISRLEELLKARAIIEEVMDDLRREEIPFDENIPVGIMIEVPSAATMADQLAKHCDFFSIGTNDLIQYLLAVDRTNQHLAHLFTPSNPAVLRLLKQVFDAGERAGIPVSVCGEMGGDPRYVLALIGMGMREASVVPTAIPEVKKVIRSTSLSEMQVIAETALTLDTAAEIDKYLEGRLEELVPSTSLTPS